MLYIQLRRKCHHKILGQIALSPIVTKFVDSREVTFHGRLRLTNNCTCERGESYLRADKCTN